MREMRPHDRPSAEDRADFSDTLEHVPIGYETICVPNCCGSHYFDDSLDFRGYRLKAL